MALPIEDTRLRQAALAYVVALYEELSGQNGAPALGTQNQAVDFILADPALRQALADWASSEAAFASPEAGEAATAPPQRLPQNALYERARAYLEPILGRPVLIEPNRARR